MAVSGGPYLSSAIFCEKILREADGVLSAIRIFDRWIVRGNTKEMPATTIPLALMVVFRAGIMRGKSQIKLSPMSPSGQQLPSIEFPVLFEGDDDRGIGIVATIGFLASEEGLYWFDLLHGEELITRIPLRVLYQQIGIAGPDKP